MSELALRLAHREFGSDLLAGIAIVTAVLLGEYLAGALVVLMLSGGEALESFAGPRPYSTRWRGECLRSPIEEPIPG